MKKEWKLGLSLVKYGTNDTMDEICRVVFFVIGIIGEMVLVVTNCLVHEVHASDIMFCGDFGIFFLMLSGSCFAQLFLSTMRSTMLASSPYNKRLQTITAPFFHLFGIILGFGVGVLARVIMYVQHPTLGYMWGMELVVMGFWGMVLLVYMAVAFKYYVISILVFYICLFGCMGMDFTELAEKLQLPFGLGIVLGLVMLLVGGAVNILISRAIYKKPLSDMAFVPAWQRGR